jgi:hypothetical protein
MPGKVMGSKHMLDNLIFGTPVLSSLVMLLLVSVAAFLLPTSLSLVCGTTPCTPLPYRWQPWLNRLYIDETEHQSCAGHSSHKCSTLPPPTSAWSSYNVLLCLDAGYLPLHLNDCPPLQTIWLNITCGLDAPIQCEPLQICTICFLQQIDWLVSNQQPLARMEYILILWQINAHPNS